MLQRLRRRKYLIGKAFESLLQDSHFSAILNQPIALVEVNYGVKIIKCRNLV